MTFVIVFLGSIALLWLLLAVSPVHRSAFADPLDAATAIDASDEDLPPVTVVIPARNEAEILPQTIPTVCEQDYPDLRVILVDDQSDDDSPRVLERLAAGHSNLTVVNGMPRPDEWCGKPWAVKQGVDHATTDWLLFTDADILFHPLAVRQAVRLIRSHDLEMLSIFPQMIFGGAAERVGMAGLVSMLSLMFPLGKANDPRSGVALAAGGFILVSRAAYEKAGGHEAVKGELIEDVNLGRKLKAAGVRVHCRYTRDLTRTRMYESFSDLWEGLAKNAYAGMEYQPHKFWVGLVVGLLVSVLPPLYLLLGVIFAVRSPSAKTWAAAALSALIVACMTVIHARTVRHLRLPLWHALLLPISSALYHAIAVHSAWQHHYRGGNVWKGRRYTREMLLPDREAQSSR